MTPIHVTCAIIERDGLVMAAQRSATMSMPLKWEFPGGKIDPGEKPEECLRRELMEEMNLRIAVRQPLPPATHDYPSVTVTLHPFICAIESGELRLHEHAAVLWLEPPMLYTLDWAAADLPVLAAYCNQLARVAS